MANRMQQIRWYNGIFWYCTVSFLHSTENQPFPKISGHLSDEWGDVFNKNYNNEMLLRPHKKVCTYHLHRSYISLLSWPQCSLVLSRPFFTIWNVFISHSLIQAAMFESGWICLAASVMGKNKTLLLVCLMWSLWNQNAWWNHKDSVLTHPGLSASLRQGER